MLVYPLSLPLSSLYVNLPIPPLAVIIAFLFGILEAIQCNKTQLSLSIHLIARFDQPCRGDLFFSRLWRLSIEQEFIFEQGSFIEVHGLEGTLLELVCKKGTPLSVGRTREGVPDGVDVTIGKKIQLNTFQSIFNLDHLWRVRLFVLSDFVGLGLALGWREGTLEGDLERQRLGKQGLRLA